jgi:hypothetical protein
MSTPMAKFDESLAKQRAIQYYTWLVVSTPLKNMKVNGKGYPIYYGKIKHVPNHQPVIP